MTVKERLIIFIKTQNMGQGAFEKKVGLSNGYVNNIRKSIQPDKLQLIARYFPSLNTGWLITGEGEMLKKNLPAYSINQQEIGVPFFDVDFIGGFNVLENDQSVNPTYYVNFHQYNKATCWVNVTGHSMSPLINHGDMVALKRIDDWQSNLLYGEVYAVVTDEYRTIKQLRKSDKGEDFLRFVPANKAEYDEQDVPRDMIRFVYQVIGCAKRIF